MTLKHKFSASPSSSVFHTDSGVPKAIRPSSKDTALFTLQDSGYQIVDWFYTPTAMDRGRGIAAMLGNVPRRLLSVVHRDLTVRLLGGYGLMVLAK